MSFILEMIQKRYPSAEGTQLYDHSYLLQYLDKKTKSVGRSSKARGSFANLYTIYVLTEDYVKKGFEKSKRDYGEYEGMAFTDVITRMRKLPFGNKLQNHAINDRCNDDFRKFFHDFTDEVPIIRNLKTRKY